MEELGRSFTVGALTGGNAKLGIAVVWLDGFEAGGYVLLRNGERQIACRSVWLVLDLPRGKPIGEVWIDEWQREDLGLSVGDTVQLTRIAPAEMNAISELTMVASSQPPESISMGVLSSFMVEHKFPIYPGFRFEFSPLGAGETITFMARRLRSSAGETSFGVCAPGAELTVYVGRARDGLNSQVSYDDIGGLDHEVDLVREMVELPMRMHNAIQTLGVAPPRGIIFYGSPGTGKTLLAKALANGAGVPIFMINPQELLSKYSGESERKLAAVFDEAEAQPHGSIILLDELDAIAGKRGDNPDSASGLITVLLTRLDGLKTRGNVVVIATTNRIETIDQALRRHGRFSREVYVPAPSREGRLQIIRVHSRRMPIAAANEEQRDQWRQEIAHRTHGFVGADLMELCREAGLNALKRAHPLSALDRGDFQPKAQLAVSRDDFERAVGSIKPSALKEVMVIIPDVSFLDIIGLDEVVDQIKQRVMGPALHEDVFAAMGLDPEKGILLYGPPGTGKTMLAKALAKECEANFLPIQGPELLSKWVGESEQGVRRVFARARQLAPAIVFFDEVEALLPARGRHEGDSGVSDRVVNQFLAELDGLAELKRVTVVAATNRRELIDPAALRSGRLGIHIYVPLPDEPGRIAMLCRYTRIDSPTMAIQEVARQTDGCSGADMAAICRDAKLIALREVDYKHATPIEQGHLLLALKAFRERNRDQARRTESQPCQ